jgi:hypothetical protein
MTWRAGIAAAGVAAILCAALACRAPRTVSEAGFWYDDFPFTFSESVTAALGGPLTGAEIDTIKRASRDELTRAFSGLEITVTDSRQAFWTIRVQQSLERRPGQKLPNAGETFAMGLLGGRSVVDFNEVVMAAIAHAPPNVLRQARVDGIARGIGRVAVHELAHAILGGGGSMDNRTDAQSYEYFTHNRPAQYYGELHWAGAWPLLVERVGLRTPERPRARLLVTPSFLSWREQT